MRTRIAVALAVALVAVLALGFVPSSSAIAPARTAAAMPCGPSDRCETPTASATAPGHRSEPCLRSASCGGGSLLAGGGVVLAVLGAAIALVALSLDRRAPSARTGTSPGRLAASRLDRPPQLSV